jgi:hypothetical protein
MKLQMEKLSPHSGCPILGLERKQKWSLAKHKLKSRLYSTSRADRVDLYGSNINGLDPTQLKQTPRKTGLTLTE